MATTKPRITITLDQRTYNVLKAISDCGDKTMSGFVSEMLDAAMPTLERMAVTFQAIKTAQAVEKDKFIASLDRAQAALEPAVMQAVGQFDLFLGAIEDAAEGRGAPACGEFPSLPSARPDPRLVTRGSTPLPGALSAVALKAVKPSSRKASSRASAKNQEKPEGCLCTYTPHERQEHKTCPVHSKKRGVK